MKPTCIHSVNCLCFHMIDIVCRHFCIQHSCTFPSMALILSMSLTSHSNTRLTTKDKAYNHEFKEYRSARAEELAKAAFVGTRASTSGRLLSIKATCTLHVPIRDPLDAEDMHAKQREIMTLISDYGAKKGIQPSRMTTLKLPLL